jgi:hypothetical protein
MSNIKIKKTFIEDDETDHQKIQKYLPLVQPYYNKLISSFSKSYLSGSEYYVGDNLLDWWNNYNIRYYKKKKKKLEYVIEMILLDKKISIAG